MTERPFSNDHNILINLDVNERGADRVAQILTYLARSRIRYAVSENVPISQNLLIQFWNNISYDAKATPPVIRTKINKRQVVFSANDLRQILHLGTEEQEAGPLEFPEALIQDALGRMGYSGAKRGRQFVKAFVYGQWRFLFHVIVSIFGNKRYGYDELSSELLSAVISLVYNRPYSFSSYIFRSINEQITGTARSKFLIYPRFCMMIINHCIPNLPAIQPDLVVSMMGFRGYNNMFQHTYRKFAEQPKETDLYGCLIDPDFVSPPYFDWVVDIARPVVSVDNAIPQVMTQDLLKDKQQLKQIEVTNRKGKRKIEELEDVVEHQMVVSHKHTRSSASRMLDKSVTSTETPVIPQVETVLEEDLEKASVSSEDEPILVGEQESTYFEPVVLRTSARLLWKEVRNEAADPTSKVIISPTAEKVHDSGLQPLCDLARVCEMEARTSRRSSRRQQNVPTSAAESLPASSSKKPKAFDMADEGVHTSRSSKKKATAPNPPVTLKDKVQRIENIVEILLEDLTTMWNCITQHNLTYPYLLQKQRNQQQQIDELKAMIAKIQPDLSSQGEMAEGSSKQKGKGKKK